MGPRLGIHRDRRIFRGAAVSWADRLMGPIGSDRMTKASISKKTERMAPGTEFDQQDDRAEMPSVFVPEMPRRRNRSVRWFCPRWTWRPPVALMKPLIKAITAAVMLTSCRLPADPTERQAGPLGFQLKRLLHLPSDDGQQGIATDGEFLYVQNTQQLFKYDLQGRPVKIGPKLRLHHGGIVWVQGRIYAAVSACDPDGSDQHAIQVYDDQSLALIEKHDIGAYFTVCAGGIAHRKGHFFVAESFFDDQHTDRIVEFDGTFRYLRQHQVPFKSPFGIQGLEYLPQRDQFQVHSHGRDFYRINAHFDGRSLLPGKAPFDLQDLARLDARTLVVNHRETEEVLFINLEMSPPLPGRRRGVGE